MFAFCLLALDNIKFSRAVAQHILYSLSLSLSLSVPLYLYLSISSSLSLNLSLSLSLSLSVPLSLSVYLTIYLSLTLTLSIHLSFSLSRKNFDEDVLGVAKDLVRGAVSLHREVMMNFRKTAQNFHYEVCDRRYSSFSSA